jgi:hypothetical protein
LSTTIYEYQETINLVYSGFPERTGGKMKDRSIKISDRALAKAGEIAETYDIPQKRVLEMAIEYLAEKARAGQLTLSAINHAKEDRPEYGKTKEGE